MIRHTIFLILFLTTSPLSPIRAQSPCDGSTITWGDEFRVSTDSSVATLPIISRAGGTLHLLWYGLDTTDDSRLSTSGLLYSRRDGEEGTFSTAWSFLPAARSLPGYLASSGARAYVTSAAILDTFFGIVLFTSADSGMTWSGAVPLLENAYPQLIFAFDSTVFIQYLDVETQRLGSLRSTDGGNQWNVNPGPIRELTDVTRFGDELEAVGPVLGGGQSEVGYFVSPDSGNFWYGPEIISPDDRVRSAQPRLAINEHGHFFSTWIDSGAVIHRSSRNRGISWGVWTRLSGEPGNVSVDIAADDQFVFVVWDRDISDTNGILGRFSVDFGESFCPVVVPGGGSGAREPGVLLRDSTVQVVWVDISGSTPGVYFRSGKLTSGGGIVTGPPESYSLKQSYPNPTNGNAVIRFDLPTSTTLTLELYNVLGERVRLLAEGSYGPGRYTVAADVSTLPSGVYFYRLSAGSFETMKKMTVLR